MNRRAALAWMAVAGAGGCARAASRRAGAGGGQRAMPAIFLAHGSPFLLEDAEWSAQLAGWAATLPRPRAVLMLSAHWVDRPITIGRPWRFLLS